MEPASDEIRNTLRLTLVPGLGPVRLQRLLDRFGSPEVVLGASSAQLQRVKGVGERIARAVLEVAKEGEGRVDDALERVRRAGARILLKQSDTYPALLRAIPGAPTLLCVRGELEPEGADRYPCAVVGSRRCTSYGLEQSERFGAGLAGAGLTLVSGGARGIDSAAHRGALNAGGRTVVVLGCGVDIAYPPENESMFERIVDEGRGALVSELPMGVPPSAENFPARNRIISGLSLGVVVIEAGRRSGALITARQAIEDQGREVLAVPGRVDSEASRGSLELLKRGEAGVATEPGDVIRALEGVAHHQFRGTHEARYVEPIRRDGAAPPPVGLTPLQARILEALEGEMTPDELARASGMEAPTLRAELTRLELGGHVRRVGSRLVRQAR
ncbi:MAG: DNA-processing protein DprA [Phycisphaerales bacterium JB059]